MKVLVSSFILATAGVTAYAQQARTAPVPATPPGTFTAPSPTTFPAPAIEARVVAELAAAAQQLGGVKNAPFTADEVNESVQTLADGNRITHSSSNKIYRNSEGGVRRDMKGGVIGGVMGATYSLSPGVSIMEPTRSQQILLDTETKIARVAELNAAQNLTIVGSKLFAEADRTKLETDRANLDEKRMELERVLTTAAPRAMTPVIVGGQGGLFPSTAVMALPESKSRYETRTEELGTRDFDGVSAEGRRTTTIIPAGAIGNERAIETVYERWYSKDLGMVVYSKRSDPRTGEQIYELKNIIRAEPDPSLFKVPTGYTKVSTGGRVYRTNPVAKSGTAVPVQRRPQQN